MPAVFIKEKEFIARRRAFSRLSNEHRSRAREKCRRFFLGEQTRSRTPRLSTTRGTLLSRVSFLWTLRRALARVYHSQLMINCAWRNILTASFLSAFKYRAKRARRDPRRERGAGNV